MQKDVDWRSCAYVGWEENKVSVAEKPRALSEEALGHVQCEPSAVALGTACRKGLDLSSKAAFLIV